VKKNWILTLVLLFVFKSLFSQNVAGEWYGVGTVNKAGEHNSYLVELVLKQAGNKVTGEFNYYFKSAKISSTITGVYLPKTRTIELKATPVLNYKAQNINGADCPMEGSFTLLASQVETVLRGQFNPLFDYRFTCPAINIKFRKGVNRPQTEPETGEVVREQLPEFTPSLAKATAIDTAVTLLNTRAFEVVDEVEVSSDTIVATLYDNSEIDNDTVSMFYDKKLIVSKTMLSDKPISFKLAVKDTGVDEISMYAENLGSLPPNTALLIVMDGEKRHEFILTSTYIKNSTIRFRKKKLKEGEKQQ